MPAAGASKRMEGVDKRQIPFRGQTVLEVTVDSLRRGGVYPIVVVLELLALVAFSVWLGASSMGGAMEGLLALVAGPMAIFFWIGVVLLALLIPLAIELAAWGKRVMWGAVAASSACVVVGGLVLRAVIVLGGQV